MNMQMASAIDHTKVGYKEVDKAHHSWRNTDEIKRTLEGNFPGIDFPFIEQDHLYGVKSDVHTHCRKHHRISRMSLAGMLYGGTKYGCDACAFENGSYHRKEAFRNKPIETSFLESGIFYALKKEFPDTTKGMLPDGKEVDIWVPSIKLGIEFDGNYWHTESKGRGGNYHLGKTVLSNKCGVGLMHLWTEEAVPPFTNIVNLAKLERDRPTIALNSKRTTLVRINDSEALNFYAKWSTKHPFFAKQCSIHFGVMHRGSIRAALSINTKTNRVEMVASSFHNFDLKGAIKSIISDTEIYQITWLCDMRSVSDIYWSHELSDCKIKMIPPVKWRLDKNNGIAAFSGLPPHGDDVVYDCGYCLMTVTQ